MRFLLAILLVLVPLATAASTTVTVIPEVPVQNEPVYIRVQSDGSPLNRSFVVFERSLVESLPNNRLRLIVAGPPNFPVEPGPVD